MQWQWYDLGRLALPILEWLLLSLTTHRPMDGYPGFPLQRFLMPSEEFRHCCVVLIEGVVLIEMVCAIGATSF